MREGFRIPTSERDCIDADTDDKNFVNFNPLAEAPSKWYEFYKRMNLFPWWIKYNVGNTAEATLRDNILQIGILAGIEKNWMNKAIRHAVAEFSKKGLGSDYYGYHNLHHELEATYFTLLSASSPINKNIFDITDLKYLFISALFHDYDPLKQFDKPNEDSVELFIRNDNKIREFIEEARLDVDIVIAIIHRTAFPFKGNIAEHAKKRMEDLFTKAKIPINDRRTRDHYIELGWFLSVSERIAGYALGNFERALDLARVNAHSLGWHPSVINSESVKYFNMLKGEQQMLTRVLEGVSETYSENLMNTITMFRNIFMNEMKIRDSIRKQKITLSYKIEETGGKKISSDSINSILSIYEENNLPIRTYDKDKFIKSISNPDTILVTLRAKEIDNKIIGFSKGGPLEKYKLRRGTQDKQNGKKNTIYMEGTFIKTGYLGEQGGHILRLQFLKESKNKGYKYVTGYVHRDVLEKRIEKGEPIVITQKYDPDKLDYYRVDLDRFNFYE